MIRYATIGTNFITRWFLEAAKVCDGLCYAAAYSRKADKAEEFAAQYGAKRSCTDLNRLAESSDVDAVYVASPNSLHYEQAALMISHGKHVLCEKTITSNKKELERLMELASEHGVIVLEAMRSVYDPGFAVIRDNLHKLGTIRRATFQYCQYSSRYDKFKNGIVENAFNPEFSNGALMDIGVYCVNPLVRLFGMPDSILAKAVLLDNGVDGAGTILAGYEKGMQAELLYSKICNSRVPSQIQGEKGCMIIREIQQPDQIQIRYNDGDREVLVYKEEKQNMVYEIRKWLELIERGKADHTELRYSLMEMGLMDEARRQMGIHFPADDRD